MRATRARAAAAAAGRAGLGPGRGVAGGRGVVASLAILPTPVKKREHIPERVKCTLSP